MRLQSKAGSHKRPIDEAISAASFASGLNSATF